MISNAPASENAACLRSQIGISNSGSPQQADYLRCQVGTSKRLPHRNPEGSLQYYRPVFATRLHSELSDGCSQELLDGYPACGKMRVGEVSSTDPRAVAQMHVRGREMTAPFRVPMIGEDMVPIGIVELVQVRGRAHIPGAAIRFVGNVNDAIVLGEGQKEPRPWYSRAAGQWCQTVISCERQDVNSARRVVLGTREDLVCDTGQGLLEWPNVGLNGPAGILTGQAAGALRLASPRGDRAHRRTRRHPRRARTRRRSSEDSGAHVGRAARELAGASSCERAR